MTADVRPLDAIIYNTEKVELKDVIAPPYDVITDDYREKLFEKSPENIVKLILPQGDADVSNPENRYEHAHKDFQKMLDDKILIKTEKPVIFYLLQQYEYQGKTVTRKGFIAKIRNEEFDKGNILPHEYTMGGPKEDRLNLTKACKANFSQVFLVYSDKEKQIENAVDLSGKPFADVTDDAGVRNIVFKIDDEKTINLIKQVLSDKKFLIADGHHRYETSLNYRNFVNSPDPEHPSKFVMSYFTNLEDDLLIYPTHRIITKNIAPEKILAAVEKYFDIEEIPFDATTKEAAKKELVKKIDESSKTAISAGLYLKDENKFRLLRLNKNVDAILDEYKVPKVLKSLDLIVLHKVIISKELGFTDEEQSSQNGILYIKQEHEAFDMIDNKEAQASFITAFPSISQIYEIAGAGERMPQKSTYFYPKLLSGIAINPLDK